uniref:Guanylyl cyclase domain containing 1 n=1 Tax=Eptatretus burgeri TaxID=7764 RepID=A0A8C4WWL6_EPTBU
MRFPQAILLLQGTGGFECQTGSTSIPLLLFFRFICNVTASSFSLFFFLLFVCAAEYVCLAVPLIQQLCHWDCGLACARMASRYARGVSEEEFLAACQKLGLGQSVWTIDLAFLMATMNLSHHFCTQTLGVDRSYENQEFYHRDFATDELRVNRRFADAADSGVKVEKRAVSMSEVETHLAAGNVAIVLTDATILHCELCSPPAVSYCCFGSALPSCYPSRKHQYQGHFVTVCGYSRPDGSVFYNNPTCDRMCICTVKNFNEARTSYGTDEDILFIYKDAS